VQRAVHLCRLMLSTCAVASTCAAAVLASFDALSCEEQRTMVRIRRHLSLSITEVKVTALVGIGC
jgi:hypothetical protein